MKVAMYNVTTNIVKGGIETLCVKASEELVRRGIDARIICGTLGDGPEEFVVNNVRYHAFPFRSKDRFPDFGTRFRKLGKRLSFGVNCMEFMRREDFDIIHIHKPFEFPLMYYLRKKGCRAKVVYNANGTDFFATDRFFFRRAVDISIASSEFNALEVEGRYGIHPIVVYNGAEEDVFRPVDTMEARRVCGLETGPHYIGTIGRLVGWKGLQVLIAAMPAVVAECPDTILLVVGDGEYRKKLEDLTRELGMGRNVRFVGKIEHSSLPAWMNSMNIVLQPSIGDEGFSLTVVEAMSCGRPVIGAPSGGTPEILVDGESGFIVPKRDSAQLADRIIRILKDPQMEGSMGKKARQRVLAEFTWGKVVDRIERIYKKVLDDNTVLP
jgi:glycosyltransferase involved in cell wall biosynthesis